MSAQSDKINLIYILSSGRSGSTILDMLLGSCTDLWTTGELMMLDYELKNEHLPCGCGIIIPDCDFWGSIVTRIQLEDNTLLEKSAVFRNEYGGGKLIRWNYIREIFSKKTSETFKSNARSYGEKNKQLIRMINEKANSIKNVKYIVDSSKDLYRLFSLHSSGLFNIKVIHLLKSPHAFAYSMTKPELKISKTVRTSMRWTVENYLVQKMVKNHIPANNYCIIKYEELAKQPEETLLYLQKKLDLDTELKPNSDLGTTQSHGIAGNIARFNTQQIKVDTAYLTGLKWSQKKLVNLISSPIRKKYGF